MNTITRAALIATAVIALLLPASTSASTIEVTASAGTNSSEYIEYRTTKGENNRVRVLFKGSTMVLVDKSTKRIRPKRGAGFGTCRATSRQRVVCPNFPLYAFLRDGNDRLSVAPGDKGLPPTSDSPLAYAESYEDTEGAVVEKMLIDAGSGDDFVSGSSLNDIILPRSGLDRVEGRGGPDRIGLQPDGVTDKIIGGGDVDSVSYSIDVPLLIDLAARTGGPPGDPDTLAQIERVHGGSGDDVIRGTDRPDALYGEGGNDEVDGRGGNDLVTGDAPVTGGVASANRLIGGDGDDIFDTRPGSPTSTVDCGAGSDSHVGGVDALLDPSCELAVIRIVPGSFISIESETELFDDPMKVAPVAKTANTVTFEAVCPQRDNTGCNGTIVLQSPPVLNEPPVNYGIGEFAGPPGRANVTVGLNAAGQAAVAGNQPVAVNIQMELQPTATNAPPTRAQLGWQADL